MFLSQQTYVFLWLPSFIRSLDWTSSTVGYSYWLVVLTILEKYESMGRIIPYIMENKKCSKPPTRLDYCNQQIKRGNAVINSPGNRVGRDLIGDGPGDNLYPRWTSTVNMEHAKKISASVTASLNDLQFEYPFVNLYDNICPKMEQTSELQVKR